MALQEEKADNLTSCNLPPMPTLSQETVMWFGQMLLRGFVPEKQYTVAEWIDHVINAKAGAGRKRKTISSYRFCSIRVKQLIGDKKLPEVQPADISDLFARLQRETVKTEARACVKAEVDFSALLKERGTSKTRLAAEAGISQSTVDRAIKGQSVLYTKASAIASALHRNPEDLFETITSEKPLSYDTLEDYRRFVSLVFTTAERELQIPYNPVKRVEKATHCNCKKVQTLQLDEVQAVLRAAEKEPIDKRCLLHMFLITGGRRGEIAGLRWQCVRWDCNAILIEHTVLYTPEDGTYCEDSTKTYQDRLIRLPQETMQLLMEYKSWQIVHKTQLGSRWIDSDYIFTGRFGGPIPPDSISSYISRFQKHYHLPAIHPHKFRHTMASILIYSGMDIVSVSKRLGHAKVSTTQNVYAHLLKKADIESAECIADAILRGQK